MGTRLRVTPAHLRSAGTGRPLGAAQAAAVVDCVARAAQPGARSYPVALAVELDAPYTVRLAQPSVLKLRELARIGKAAREGDFEAYVELVERLRGRSAGTQSRGFTRDLFDLPAVEPAAVYTDFVKRLRGRPPAEHARGLTRDLFDFSALEPVPVLGTAGDPQGSLLP